MQIEFFDPGLTGTIFFNTNGQDFRIDGTETSFVAQIWQGLKLEGAGAWNSSEQTNSPAIIDNNPASENYGKPITEVCLSGPSSCAAVGNPFGPRGAPAADSPPLRFNLRLRYDWPIASSSYFQYLDGAVAHVQIGMVHTGHTFTQAGSNPPFVPGVTVGTARIRFADPAYRRPISVGLEKDALDLQRLRAEHHQFARDRLHQHGQFHRGADTDQAASARREFHLQLLMSTDTGRRPLPDRRHGGIALHAQGRWNRRSRRCARK